MSSNATPLPATPDFDSWPIEHTITDVHHASRTLTLVWSDGRRSHYHSIWLRENAADDSTINPATRERILDLSRLSEWPVIDSAHLDDAGALSVTFAPEQIELRFHPGWLRAHDYSHEQSNDTPFASAVPWRGADHGEPFSLDASGWLERESDPQEVDPLLEEALGAVMRDGIVRLRGLPTREQSLDTIAHRIGIPRPTNFGALFDVRSKPDPDSNAYTAIALPPHVDLPTREYQPGLQLLHCLKNDTSGGSAVMLDGFAVAERMRQDYPTQFETLTRVKWCFANTARSSDYVWHAPLIALDDAGNCSEIRTADFLRGPLMVPFDEVEAAYAALMVFQRLLGEPEFAMRFNYLPGDLVIFDNRRLLHGRDAFDPGQEGGSRWLRGCYLERDEVRSRLRMLARARRRARVEAE
ncbi:TauD/TfdA family dioxygenase [Kushneria aurantia]|uniref:TauD/TfdA family dioxygenase n=1 Tax=Kushneria aurantia TaxID=504092 RepID=A0ABV6FZL9_9GAMM|nr:TauD/TfdA family dioxygenase [Kushneria aurantia]